MKKTRRALVIAVLCLLALGVALTLTRRQEYVRLRSPDGRYYAVATSALYQSLLPRMPGQGGDRPGTVTIYTRDGARCGTAPVEMVQFIYDLRWEPGAARIPLVAEWDLQRRTVLLLR